MLKILRVNMTQREAAYEEVPEKYICHGGRSFVVRVATDEIDPVCDPLGPDNKLIVTPSLFTGTPITTGNRISVGGKSPLTGGIKEASSGGTVAIQMVKQSLKAIIVEGMPDTDDLYILYVDPEGKASVIETNEYKGLQNFELDQKLKERFSGKISVLVSGLAGERKQLVAGILITDMGSGFPTRAAGRGGMGAVMGSKGLKAIVIDKAAVPYKLKMHDEQKLKETNKEYAKLLMQHPALKNRCRVGTAGGVKAKEQKGIIPTKNFRGISFPEAENMDGENFYNYVIETGGKVGLACQPGCVIRCSQVFKKDGEFFSSGVQYETIGLCGTNLLISDLSKVVEISTRCDNYGVDTIDFGAAMGLFMEAGILEWGDADGVLGMLDELIAGDSEYGKLIPKGTRAIAKALNVDRVPQAKGQAFAAYDPRGSLPHAAQFSWGAQGADHIQGAPVPDKEGNWTTVTKTTMPLAVALDSCMCLFGQFPILFNGEHEYVTRFFKYLLGEDWDFDKALRVLGDDTVTLEHRFNEKAGVGGVEPLPKFLFEEKSSVTGKALEYPADQFEQLYTEYLNRDLSQPVW